MIWLASFPRSGNTYARNILKEVYSIDSSYDDEPGWEEQKFVKTHFLPQDTSTLSATDKVIYLLRDGRDCTVSLGHHMKDIAKTGDNFHHNMVESIVAAEGSYFGGWSNHVFHWLKRADIVIRYEDLIADPIGQMERLRTILNLPEPEVEKLPTFEKLKESKKPYGIVTEEWKEDKNIAQKFYRKGKAGSWKEEMPKEIEQLFWSCHGDIMEVTGYFRNDSLASFETFRK